MSRDNQNIDDFFFNALNEYKEEPSPAVKQAIKAKVKPYNLLKFNSLNTIFVVLGLLAFTATTFYLYNNNSKTAYVKDNSLNSSIQNTNNKNNTIKLANNNIKNTINEININNTNNTKDITKNYTLENKNTLNENNLTEKTKSSKTIDFAIKNQINNKKYSRAKNISNNMNSETTINNIETQPVNSEYSSTESIQNVELQTNSNKAVLSNSQHNSILTKTLLTDSKNISFVSPKSININTNSTDWVDTIGKDYLGQPIVFNEDWNSIEFYYSPFYHYSIFEANNSENSALSSLLKNITQETWSQSHGVSLTHQEKNWFFQIGFAYMEYNQKFKNNNFITNPHDGFNLINTGNPWDFTDNGDYYKIDTVGSFMHYTYIQDSIIHIKDSSIVYLTDTSQVAMFDTMQVTLYDTLKQKSLENKVSYYEIPFHFGYEINKGALSYSLKGGVYVGILRKTSGYQIAPNNNALIIENQEKYYSQFTYSFSVSLGLTYHINEYFGIIIEPYYRRNINSIFDKDYPVSLKCNLTGIKLGLKYNF